MFESHNIGSMRLIYGNWNSKIIIVSIFNNNWQFASFAVKKFPQENAFHEALHVLSVAKSIVIYQKMHLLQKLFHFWSSFLDYIKLVQSRRSSAEGRVGINYNAKEIRGKIFLMQAFYYCFCMKMQLDEKWTFCEYVLE